ncbi:MAG TPA: LEA type 2 family protein [Candidatus Sumerlaeota bacterium]|nr:LEA type 2 family protein [Candidatus Sumerlaeota bacterium]HPS00329.1 LEA type 2 family protein [Candidatus Sumerlaeota bacterium]
MQKQQSAFSTTIRIARVSFLLALLALGNACALWQGLSSDLKPSVEIAGVQIKNIGMQSATLQFNMAVKNPYSVALPVVGLDYSLASQGGDAFLTGKAPQQGSVPARGNKTLALPVELRYNDILKTLQGIQMGAVVPYKAQLGLSVQSPVGGALRLPIQKEGEFPIPAMPEVKVSDVKWENLSLLKADGRVRLSCVNRNQFPLDLSKFQYALSLGDVEVARSAMNQAVHFNANGGEGALEIPISFSPAEFGMAMFKLLNGDEAGYRVKGAFDVKTPFGPMSLPVDKMGRSAMGKKKKE